MRVTASQFTCLLTVCLAICSGWHQREHQSPHYRLSMRGIHQWLVDLPHKGPVTWKIIPFCDVIMKELCITVPIPLGQGDYSYKQSVMWKSYQDVVMSKFLGTWQPALSTVICLTHNGLLISLSNCLNIGSGNGLLPVWHQTNTRTNVGILSSRPFGTNNEIRRKMWWFSLKKMYFKFPSAICPPFCLGLSAVEEIKINSLRPSDTYMHQ